jgi:hypothetical protein
MSPTEPSPRAPRRRWSLLPAHEQLALRERYGRHLDTLPPTCDLGTKMDRFRDWLALQGVDLDRLA